MTSAATTPHIQPCPWEAHPLGRNHSTSCAVAPLAPGPAVLGVRRQSAVSVAMGRQMRTGLGRTQSGKTMTFQFVRCALVSDPLCILPFVRRASAGLKTFRSCLLHVCSFALIVCRAMDVCSEHCTACALHRSVSSHVSCSSHAWWAVSDPVCLILQYPSVPHTFRGVVGCAPSAPCWRACHRNLSLISSYLPCDWQADGRAALYASFARPHAALSGPHLMLVRPACRRRWMR